MTDTPVRADTWHEIVLATLKSNNVKLVTYVPDRVFTPLIKALHDDAFFTTFAATREEEAVGIVAGAWMGGMRGAVLMQTSGFATIPNALASLVVPCQIPALIFVGRVFRRVAADLQGIAPERETGREALSVPVCA